MYFLKRDNKYMNLYEFPGAEITNIKHAFGRVLCIIKGWIWILIWLTTVWKDIQVGISRKQLLTLIIEQRKNSLFGCKIL